MVMVPFEKESLSSPPKSSERKLKPMLSEIVFEGEQIRFVNEIAIFFFRLKKVSLGQFESQA